MLQSLQSASIPSRTELQKFTSRPVRFGFVPVQTTRSGGLRLEARLARQVHPAVAAVEEHRDVVNSRALGHDRGPLRRWHVRVPRERVPEAKVVTRKGHVHIRKVNLRDKVLTAVDLESASGATQAFSVCLASTIAVAVNDDAGGIEASWCDMAR